MVINPGNVDHYRNKIELKLVAQFELLASKFKTVVYHEKN